MSGQELYLELQTKVTLLNRALRELGDRGRAAADAEREYRVALAQKLLSEREKGLPATLLPDICRGDREIARLKFQRDVADTVYKAALEACNVYKLQIRVLENQIDREYRG